LQLSAIFTNQQIHLFLQWHKMLLKVTR